MWLFYRKVESNNIKNIPKKTPVILAINHQNALMDAMAFVQVLRKQPTFVARADIFKVRFIAKILMFLKILPIFRERDGKKSLKNNEEVNNIIVNGLVDNCIFGIMPEGSHSDQRKIRPLKKGIMRIAFEVQEKLPRDKSVVIIPVGIDYGHYINCKTTMFVNFGKPIKVTDFMEEHKKNAPKAINTALTRIKQGLQEVSIDIQQKELYDMFDSIRSIYRPNMLKKLKTKGKQLFRRFSADKETIRKLNIFVENNENEANKLNEKVKEFTNGVKKMNLRDWVLTKKKYSIIGLFLQSIFALTILPIHIVGVVTNYLPYKIPVWGSKNVKDPQFLSSFRYVIALISFLIFYITYITLTLIFAPVWWMKLAIIFGLPICGNTAIHYYLFIKKLWAKWRYTFKYIRKDKLTLRLQELRKEIIEVMDSI